MTTVQSVGVNDYQMPVQDVQAQEQYPEIANDMAIYDPEVEEKKSAAKSQTGMMALGVLGLAGATLGAVKWHSASKLGKQVKQLEAEKADIAKKLADKKEALNKEYALPWYKRLARTFKPTAFMTDEEKIARQEAKDAAKAAKEAEKAAKNAEKEAKKAEKKDK